MFLLRWDELSIYTVSNMHLNLNTTLSVYSKLPLISSGGMREQECKTWSLISVACYIIHGVIINGIAKAKLYFISKAFYFTKRSNRFHMYSQKKTAEHIPSPMRHRVPSTAAESIQNGGLEGKIVFFFI